MSRKRMLDPGIWTDEGFLEMSMSAKLVYIGLISNADDQGRGYASPKSIKAKILPGEFLSLEAIQAIKAEIAANTRTRFYEAGGTEYYALDRWLDYQVINKPTPSKIPAPVDNSVDNSGETTTTVGLPEHYGSPTVGLPYDYHPIERNRIEENRREDTQSACVRACAIPDSTVVQEQGVQEPAPSIFDSIPVSTPAKSEPPQAWIANEYYRAWSRRSATLVAPRGNDFQAAHGLLASIGGRLSPEIKMQVGAAIDRYLDHWQDYWFARKGKPPGPVSPNHSFAGFCQHYPELAVETTAEVPDWEHDPAIQAMLAGGS